MKNFSLIFFITLIFFVVLNFFIALSWSIYSNLNLKKHSYIDEQKKLLNLSDEDLTILYNESWNKYTKFRFVPFIGHTETKLVGKFVNFTEKNGRKIDRPKVCNKNVYLYGGSTTFGYNVTDNQTIGSYLQKILGSDYCVFNHGRAYFYSKQENNLFTNHLENGKKIHKAFFLDGINERCGGYEYDQLISNSFSLFNDRPYSLWKTSIKNFVLTLPFIQLSNSLFGSNRWIHDNNNNILEIDTCMSQVELNKLFESRVLFRESICDKFKIDCYSILQPFPGIHGVQIRQLLSENKEEILKMKYKKLSTVSRIIDLGYVFQDDKTLSYIDGIHYSPQSNQKIASELNKILN